MRRVMDAVMFAGALMAGVAGGSLLVLAIVTGSAPAFEVPALFAAALLLLALRLERREHDLTEASVQSVFRFYAGLEADRDRWRERCEALGANPDLRVAGTRALLTELASRNDAMVVLFVRKRPDGRCDAQMAVFPAHADFAVVAGAIETIAGELRRGAWSPAERAWGEEEGR